MPWNLLILPLLGGFFFLTHCYQFRFAFQRHEGYRLVMHSAVCGALLVVAGRAVTFAAEWTSWGRWLERYCAMVAPFPFVGTAFMAFALGLILPVLWNRIVPKQKAIARAMGRTGDDLLALLYLAAETNTPIYITLDTRKIYVGFVVNAPNLEQEKTSVGLLPLRSGYRAEKDLRTEFTVFYEQVYLNDDVDPYDFQVTIPVSRIVSAHFYDPQIYNRFFSSNSAATGPQE